MSNKTFVIKYSDKGGNNTILEHTQIIEIQNKVCWGWWKQFDEYNQFRELKELGNKGSIVIGAVNIESKEYYKADCVKIHIGTNENSLIPSPYINLTPEYYKDKNCQAWFELVSLDKITETEFESLFYKKDPYGDASLFIVTDDKIKESEIDKVDLAKFSTTKGNAILHLSDLHFGTDHNFSDGIKIFKKKTLFEAIKQLIDKYKNDIGVVVASGDFISRANLGQSINSFNSAQAFLIQLLKYLELEPENLIVIPGNHDMPLIENDGDPSKDGNYTTQFRDFRRSIKKSKLHPEGVHHRKEIEFWAGFKTPNNWNIIFSYFNSAELKYKYLSNFGFISEHRYKRIFENLYDSIGINEQSKFIENRIINFCVIHHHLKMFMPTQEIEKPTMKDLPSESVCVLLNCGEFEKEAIDAGMHFVLHGHQHIPYVGSTGNIKNGQRKNLNILSAGSLGSVLSKGYEKFHYNSFSVYYPQETNLKVIIEKFNIDSDNPYPEPEIVEVPYL